MGPSLQCAAAALRRQLSQHHQRCVAPQRQLPADQQPGHHSQGGRGGTETNRGLGGGGRGGVLECRAGRRGRAAGMWIQPLKCSVPSQRQLPADQQPGHPLGGWASGGGGVATNLGGFAPVKGWGPGGFEGCVAGHSSLGGVAPQRQLPADQQPRHHTQGGRGGGTETNWGWGGGGRGGVLERRAGRGGGQQERGSSPSSAACRPNGNFLLTSSLDTHVEGGLVGWVVGRWKLGPGGVG